MTLRSVDAERDDRAAVTAAGQRILLVEDDQDLAAVTARLLTARGYRPTVAGSAIEALRQSRRLSFALALVDISLGGDLDGIDVGEWLSRLYEVPIVFTTSLVDDDVLARAGRIRPAGYLVKPIDPPQLYSAVVMATTAHQPAASAGGPRGRDAAYLSRKLEQIRHLLDETRVARQVLARQPDHLPSGIEELSAREWQIMRDLIDTPSAEAIAQRRHLSVHTVHNHLKSVFRKLEVHSTAELLALLLAGR
jgi:DNA-binding NarL/FixJ family response regulator